MPPWVPRALTRIRTRASAGRVTLTEKAIAELMDLRLEHQDAAEILLSLAPSDRPARLWSGSPGEWLYVFRPVVGGLPTYLKVAIRTDCVVISFHEDRAEEAKDSHED